MYDVVYIGSNFLNLLKCHLDVEHGINSIIIEKSSNLGGAWQAVRLHNGVETELGGHIFYKNKKAFRKLTKIQGLKVSYLTPQPSVLIENELHEDDKLSFYLASGKWKEDGIIVRTLKLSKYMFEKITKGKHFYFEQGALSYYSYLYSTLDKKILTGEVTEVQKTKQGFKISVERHEPIFAKKVILSRGCKVNTILGTQPRYERIETIQVYLVLSLKLSVRNFLSFGIPTYAQLGEKKRNSQSAITLIRISDLTGFSNNLDKGLHIYCCSVACDKDTINQDNNMELIYDELIDLGLAPSDLKNYVVTTEIKLYSLHRMRNEDFSKLVNLDLEIYDITDMSRAIGKYL